MLLCYQKKIEMDETVAWELAKKRFEEIEGYTPDINNRTHELMVASLQEGILAGAKWQAEQMYSREEVIELINKISEELDFESATQKTIDNWIQQNLK
jgi:hypothetical protein